MNYIRDTIGAYALHVLKFLPWIENMTVTEKMGLNPGTLYDTLEVNSGSGNATVAAIGFDISCGFATGVNTNWSEATQLWTVRLDNSIGEVHVPYTRTSHVLPQPGIVESSDLPNRSWDYRNCEELVRHEDC